jgi:aryl-alcohol dehydrogenase-like predicted oxidoreductase
MAAAAAVIAVADEIGRTPSQTAINWVRQKASHIIPILGARRESQLSDNLGVLEFALSTEQLERLDRANPLPTFYPHSFWNDFVRRDLIFGERVEQLDGRRQGI